VSAHLAAAHELLRLGGHGAANSANKVAALCREFDVRTASGQSILPKQISGSREAIRRNKASAIAVENYDNVIATYEALNQLTNQNSKFRYSEDAARAVVRNLSNLAARAAPDRQRRAEK
jgi:hypothetical protein